jgi:hypothetical protein
VAAAAEVEGEAEEVEEEAEEEVADETRWSTQNFFPA